MAGAKTKAKKQGRKRRWHPSPVNSGFDWRSRACFTDATRQTDTAIARCAYSLPCAGDRPASINSFQTVRDPRDISVQSHIATGVDPDRRSTLSRVSVAICPQPGVLTLEVRLQVRILEQQ